MKIAVVLLFSMISFGVFAGQYTCTTRRAPSSGPDKGVLINKTIEASSLAEANYKIREQYPAAQTQGAGLSCKNAVESEDIFVRDIRFSQNKQLRPYIPPDLRPSGKAGYSCNSSGGFRADNDPVIGGCAFYMSNSPAAEWRIRFVNNGTANKVWRMTQGTWAPWVELGEAPNVYEVISISPQAQQFAASRGAGPQPASARRGNQTDNPAMPQQQPGIYTPTNCNATNVILRGNDDECRALIRNQRSNQTDNPAPTANPNPNPNPNPIDDLVKQGIGGLLKGFGR